MTQNANKRVAVWKRTGGKCWYCGLQLHSNSSQYLQNDYMHIEHQVPKELGGGDDLSNLVPSCHTCNGRKGTKGVPEFRRYMRFVNVGIEPMTDSQIVWCIEQGFDVMATLPELVFWGEDNHD